MTAPDSAWRVVKLGGTSVSACDAWESLAEELHGRAGPVLLVCSALAGTTDLLEALSAAALKGQQAGPLEELRTRHETWARDCGIPLPPEAELDLTWLGKVAEGIGLVGEVSPRLKARILAAGERISTRLVASLLQGVGPRRVAWVDARELLVSTDVLADNPSRHFLSASVEAQHRPELAAGWAAQGLHIVVTQGFVASDPHGQTVVLGRGGSDTSATLLGATIGAERVEIWTDVPGLFTANPRAVAGARLISVLDYAEAQEIATTGAKVLHPACILPARQAGIPIEIVCTRHPEWPGTVIGTQGDRAPNVKAVSSRRGIVLVSMETVGMWQEVGFLYRAFGCFARLGLSVDLVATSETSVTVSLDPTANALDSALLQRLVTDLSGMCTARVIDGCASVSLVGRGIRSILHRLAGVFELFEEQRVHLVSQAASDLNLTVVVDAEQAPRLVRQLHTLLFSEVEATPGLGPTWEALQQGQAASPRPDLEWWASRQEELLGVAAGGTPVYAYSRSRVLAAARSLTAMESVEHVLFSIKANPHAGLLELLVAEGLGLECVSPGELERARAALGPAGGPLLFTPNFVGLQEYSAGFEQGAFVTVDNLGPLLEAPEVFAGREIFLRIDPGRGQGHHKHVRTAGAVSKFGIPPSDWQRAGAWCQEHGITVVGLHAHVGSGVRDPETWPATARVLAQVAADHFPGVRILDLGGGLGVPVKPGQEPLDIGALDRALLAFRAEQPHLSLWLEPGRFLVAEAGVLLATVTQLKDKGGGHRYVGVDAGMHTLIRPALYGAWHPIVNLSRLHEPRAALTEADVVGPICESGDVLGHDRRIREPSTGQVLLIGKAGAYGASMASGYNSRGLPREVLVD